MNKLITLSLAVLITALSFAQEQMVEGVMTNKQSMSSDNEMINAQLQRMSMSNSKTYFKGQSSRSNLGSSMTGGMVVIINGDKKQMLTLVDQPGGAKKYMLKSTDPSAEDMKTIEVTKGDKTKTVLGYECQQYLVSMMQNGKPVEMELFTADKISAMNQNTAALGDKINGYPLYFVLKMQQMGSNLRIVNEVIKIQKEEVSESMFSLTIPEGYTKMEGM